MARSVSEKIGVKENARTIFVNAESSVIAEMDFPKLDIKARLSSGFDYIHCFVTLQSELRKLFPKLKMHLKPAGMLWVSWPKSGQKESDLNIKNVIEIGYDHGLVESKTISVNSVWSAIKFTHPKAGKKYNNSYGKLKR
jgi:hypothetical protein